MTQEVIVNTPDGFSLNGLLERPDSSANSCVILCHGLSVDKEEKGAFTRLAAILSAEGFHTFRFDFRGCGKSSGMSTDYTITDAVTDLNSVIAYIKTSGYTAFIILAASFSGGCVSYYAGQNPKELHGVVLWNALIDYEEKINPTTERNRQAWGEVALESIKKQGYVERPNGFRLGKKLMDNIYSLKPWQELLKYKGPLVFIHGTADNFVPHSYSLKYAKELPQAKVVLIEGAEHGFHDTEDHFKQAESAVIEFVREVY